MDKPRISYTPHPDVTPAAEQSVLATCYRIILDSAKTRGRLPDKSGPDDGTEFKEDSANEHRST